MRAGTVRGVPAQPRARANAGAREANRTPSSTASVTEKDMNRTSANRGTRGVFAIACFLVTCAAVSPAWAQKLFDDHEMEDRFYITIGGFQQDEMRTTVRVDAKTPEGGIAAGAVIALESLFSVDDNVTTARLDGWYRLNRKSRLNWTYWRTDRDGNSVYESDDPVTIGDVTISQGDSIEIEDKSMLMAVSYSYSFVHLEKFEAWLGGGFNFQRIDTKIVVDVGGQGIQTRDEEAKATVPVPLLNFGMRYSFSKRLRMLVLQNLFGLRVGDFSGRLNDTRLLAEYGITKHFGLGAGLERFSLQIDAEGEDFNGSYDASYTGLSLYLKGQL
jgi:hypothetical protein